MEKASCVVPYIGLREKADDAATQVTQVLFADPVDVAQRADGWAQVTLADGYEGWMPADGLGDPLPKDRAHVVVVPQAADRYLGTWLPAPGLRTEPLAAACEILDQVHFPCNSEIAVLGDGKLGLLVAQVLTLAALFAMKLPPLQSQKEGDSRERPRIALNTQLAMLSVIVAYVFAMAIVGGAELARYMLPVVPLVILIAVSTLWRRVLWWRGVVTIVVFALSALYFSRAEAVFSDII